MDVSVEDETEIELEIVDGRKVEGRLADESVMDFSAEGKLEETNMNLVVGDGKDMIKDLGGLVGLIGKEVENEGFEDNEEDELVEDEVGKDLEARDEK